MGNDLQMAQLHAQRGTLNRVLLRQEEKARTSEFRFRRKATPAWVKCALLGLPQHGWQSPAACLTRYYEVLASLHLYRESVLTEAQRGMVLARMKERESQYEQD
jgi:hypothetical protein